MAEFGYALHVSWWMAYGKAVPLKLGVQHNADRSRKLCTVGREVVLHPFAQ